MTSSLDPIVLLALVVGAIAAVVLAGVLVALAVFTLRFRDPGVGSVPQIHGHRTLEIAWTVAPLAVLAAVFVASLLTLRQLGSGASFPSLEPPLVIEVVGHQWWFELRYPGGAVTANEIHIPVGTPIELRLASADVIHDLWVPALGPKSDIIPGQRNVLHWFSARSGSFSGACAEFCGLEHAWMRVRVVAEPRADFERWLAGQAGPATGTVGPGSAAFASAVCSACHVIRGQVAGTAIGPDLTHLASRATLAGGVLANDAAGLRAWISDPQRHKPGALMPAVPLSDAERDAIVAYLGSLR